MASQADSILTDLAALEQIDMARLRCTSLEHRSMMLILACRSASQLEASRRQMGLAASEPVPWPSSTWEFLAEAASRVREE
jgi:hypothetical protein